MGQDHGGRPTGLRLKREELPVRSQPVTEWHPLAQQREGAFLIIHHRAEPIG